MKRYERYKPSGIEWIGEIPDHWEVRKLKYVGQVQLSGVDKKNEPEERKVLLCNYIDVYKNEFIDDSLSFMEASATKNEIERFALNRGDVLITKDSETPDDIANPAFVRVEKVEIICGYHLAHIRTNRDIIIGEYLFRLFQSPDFNAKFTVNAHGITRYGLSIDDIKSTKVLLPTVNEQTGISNYLDRKTAQIDELIAKKRRLIDLLNEEKTAIISQAVTKGLNPDAPLKNTGVPWLGDIPETWTLAKFNHYIFLRHGYQFRDYDFTLKGIKVVKITQLKPDGTLDIDESSYIDENRLDDFKNIIINEGDILMALTGGTIGKIIRVGKVSEPLLQNYRVGNFFPKNERINKDFLFWILSSQLILSQIFYEQRETGQPNVGKEDFSKMNILLPPIDEQIEIATFLMDQTKRLEKTIFGIRREIELIIEYRSALISEGVTGKIDVRGVN